MASTSEVGHAKNVANFQDLIAFVNGYGATYNPSKNSLKAPELQNLYTAANESVSTVTTQNTRYNNTVNDRVIAFQDLRPLSTRIINALATTDATNETIKDAKVFNRKIQGKRASTPVTPLDPDAPAPTTISSSQQSYDQLIQHFQGFISVLADERTYTPNETELQVATLQTKLQELQSTNERVSTAHSEISNARLARNNKLYNNGDSLVPTAADVKKYVKSVYGATSPEYGLIKGIKFRIVKT